MVSESQNTSTKGRSFYCMKLPPDVRLGDLINLLDSKSFLIFFFLAHQTQKPLNHSCNHRLEHAYFSKEAIQFILFLCFSVCRRQRAGARFATGVNYTSGKFATDINNIGGKFVSGVKDTGGVCHR
jgi:hypothetical protein